MKNEINKSVNQLKKLFSYLPEIKEEDMIPTDKLVGYMDKTNVIMVIPKTYYMKTILTQDFDVTESKIPEINYNNISGYGSYSTNLLTLILPLLKNTKEERVLIKCGKETPITLETKEIIVIVAPRVDYK